MPPTFRSCTIPLQRNRVRQDFRNVRNLGTKQHLLGIRERMSMCVGRGRASGWRRHTFGAEMGLIIEIENKELEHPSRAESSPGRLMETYFTSCNSALDACKLKSIHTLFFILEIFLILLFKRESSGHFPPNINLETS